MNKFRQAFAFSVATLLFFASLLVYAAQYQMRSNREVTTHQALTQSLGPIEIVKATYMLTGDDVGNFRCRIKNISNRDVAAMGLIWTVTFSGGGTLHFSQSTDSLVHKDIGEGQELRNIAPQEERERRLASSESLASNASIHSVKVRVDFVEFPDLSGIGLEESKLYRQVLGTRRGAELYRSWIASFHRRSTQNPAAVVEKLLSEELPNVESLQNADVQHGADLYRRWLRDMHSKNGADAVTRILSRK